MAKGFFNGYIISTESTVFATESSLFAHQIELKHTRALISNYSVVVTIKILSPDSTICTLFRIGLLF